MFEEEPLPDSTSIVMLGNSLTEFGGDWNNLLGESHVMNRGIMGDDATGILHRLHQICPFSPQAIFLECGTNDLSHGLSAEEVADSIILVIEAIRSQSPSSHLYIQSVFPINEDFGKWKRLKGRTNDIPLINSRLSQYCRKHQLPFVDVFSALKATGSNKMRTKYCADGIHLTPAGYLVWAKVLRPYFLEIKKGDIRD